MTAEHDGAQEIAIPKGVFVHYGFYTVDPAWRRLPHSLRDEHKAELTRLLESVEEPVAVRSYSLAGIRADAELLLWLVAPSPIEIQRLNVALLGTALGASLRPAYAYLALTKRSIYVRNTHVNDRRRQIAPSGGRYLFVYPFVKTRAWYQLSIEERQRMMNEHIRIGHKYPSVKLNTTYSFGMDDQEFVVAFETDTPEDFVDLVMELREAESSLYTVRDVPAFTCIAMPIRDTLDALDGTLAATPLPVAVAVG